MTEKLEFHFKGGSADAQQLPVEYVVDLLSNIKDLTYLIVSQAHGISYNERFKPSKEIRDNYIIKCEVPKSGSYALPISIDYIGQEQFLNQVNPGEKITQMFQWLVNSTESEIVSLLPNRKIRAKALTCIRNALPSLNGDVYVEIKTNNNITPIINSRSIQKNITTIIDNIQNIAEKHMTVVTGRLTIIDFDEKKIVIHHPGTRRALDCFYSEEIENMLFENRRQLVQITGDVTLDDNEQPKKITNVINIQEIDLSPIELDYIDWNNKKLRFKNNLALTPKLDDTEQLYTINYPELGLDVFAYTRQELTDCIKSDIVYLWEEYAITNDTLTENAKVLRSKLIGAIEEAE